MTRHANHALSLPRLPTVLAVCIAALFAGGCAVTPEPLTDREVKTRVQADQYKIYSDQEQVFHPIGFKEALARSLSYNLDYRLKLMESALSHGLAEVANYDMLPNLLVSAGYTQRNNITGSQSFQIVNGAVIESSPPSYSGGQEKQRRLAGAEFSWSLLDFGVGYYRAKQQADNYLIAEERRRRVVQNILQDVRSAYWRAVGAQRLAKDAERLMERVRSALERSRAAEAQGLLSPKDALSYQRVLLDAVSLLTSRRQELDFAKRELAALMNITPGLDFSVAEESEPELFPMPVNVAELEELALTNRPELRQEDYQRRITTAETRRQMLYLFPNLSLNVGVQYDSNKYLYNNNWLDTSAKVTFNLLRALAIPATQEAREAQVHTDDMRRMALSMAILTQVRVALERYQMSLNDLEVAKESHQVDQRVVAYTRAAMSSRIDSELELIRAETRALNSEFQRYSAYASAQAAFGRIYNSVGLDVLPEGMEKASISQIGEAVAAHVTQIENETFVKMVTQEAKLPTLALRFDGAHAVVIPAVRQLGELKADGRLMMERSADTDVARISAGSSEKILAAVGRTLTRNRLQLSQTTGAHTLAFKLLIDRADNGVRRAQWLITLLAPDGSKLGESRYTSALAADPTDSSITAFAEAAAISNLRNITTWLQAKTAN